MGSIRMSDNSSRSRRPKTLYHPFIRIGHERLRKGFRNFDTSTKFFNADCNFVLGTRYSVLGCNSFVLTV